MIQPELIADYQCHIGENPLWHPLEQRLYWTDITRGKLFRYDPATGKHEQCYSGPPVGGFTVQADGTLLLFMARGAIAQWRDGHLNYLVEEISDERESRFNDVIADPAGQRLLWDDANVDPPGSPLSPRPGWRASPAPRRHWCLEWNGLHIRSPGACTTLTRPPAASIFLITMRRPAR